MIYLRVLGRVMPIPDDTTIAIDQLDDNSIGVRILVNGEEAHADMDDDVRVGSRADSAVDRSVDRVVDNALAGATDARMRRHLADDLDLVVAELLDYVRWIAENHPARVRTAAQELRGGAHISRIAIETTLTVAGREQG